MASPGERGFGEDLAPRFALLVEGTQLEADLTKYISAVEFESSVDMADIMRVRVVNPGHVFSPGGDPDLVSHKAFAQGNEADLYLGYGDADTFIGRAIFAKHRVNFPQRQMPFLDVIGYDKSYIMMGNQGKITGGGSKRPKLVIEDEDEHDQVEGDADNQGKVWGNIPHGEIVTTIASNYGMATDVAVGKFHQHIAQDEGIVQPKGMTDYELVKTLGDLNDYVTRVFWDNDGSTWKLSWKEPRRNAKPEFVFRYGAGDKSTLLRFEEEHGLRGNFSHLVVLAWNENIAKWVSVVLIEDATGPDPTYRKGSGLASRQTPTKQRDEDGFETEDATHEDQLIEESITSSTRFRIAAGGQSIDIIAGRPFRDMEDVAVTANRWFRRQKDNFILARGTIVGVETMLAEQVHILDGLGKRLSGDYYFTSVNHRMKFQGAGLPYTCEFTAHKVIE